MGNYQLNINWSLVDNKQWNENDDQKITIHKSTVISLICYIRLPYLDHY